MLIKLTGVEEYFPVALMPGPDCLVVVSLPSLAVHPQTAGPVLPGPARAGDGQVGGTSRLLGYRLVAGVVPVRSDL